MRTFVLFVLLTTTALSDEAPRPTMTDAPADSGDIEGLVERAADCCTDHDLDGFLDCFTRRKRSSLKPETKKLFSQHKVEMRVLSTDVLMEEEGKKTVRVEYTWDVDELEGKRVTSNLTAKIEDGEWRIDSEKILSSKKQDESTSSELSFGGGGRVTIASNPEESKDEDIGTWAGKCSGGKCTVPPALPKTVFQELPAHIKVQFLRRGVMLY